MEGKRDITGVQLSLFSETPEVEAVIEAVREILNEYYQPSAWELLNILDQMLGLKARWNVDDAMERLIDDSELTNAQRDYIRDLLYSEDWSNAKYGSERPAHEVESTIDALLHESEVYRSSESFQDMISFMANFREYAPFNNMLVRMQNRSCRFYATQSDWENRFKRHLKEDVHPLIILAPMHPVMLVYDLDSTEGPDLPQHITQFAKFQGNWNPKWLERASENATTRDLIRIETKELSSTHAGFATISVGKSGMKMRIGLHKGLDEPSRYGVLMHELAHIYLGHLGGDKDKWWPSRVDLGHKVMEVEAEAVAYIVSRRAGLQGASQQYVAGYLDDESIPKRISLDMIAKVAGRLENMSKRILGKRRSGQSQIHP